MLLQAEAPVSFRKPRRYGDCVQLYDLFVVHLSQSRNASRAFIFSVIFIQIH